MNILTAIYLRGYVNICLVLTGAPWYEFGPHNRMDRELLRHVTKYMTDSVSRWIESLSAHEFWDESRHFVPPIRFSAVYYDQYVVVADDIHGVPNLNENNVHLDKNLHGKEGGLET